jgi:alkanesulfonate monooxygenase SsuD/methylene tetrahydromethanopterin reductase-like flavin-dependent oxidoreductase (luciferase family)
MRVMGQPPMPIAEFREYLRVIRELLAGHAVEYSYGGRVREIQFLHRDRRYINLDQPIPIYVAANGPRACKIAGEFGDGWVTAGGLNPRSSRMGLIREGAKEAGRELPAHFHTAALTSACVLRRGEKLTSERVINQTGAQVASALHFVYETWKTRGRNDAAVPPFFRDIWEDYLTRVENFRLPPNARFRQIHEGHGTFLQPDERKYVTPQAIQGTCLAGEPDEIIAQIREMEKAGIREVLILPPADTQREVFAISPNASCLRSDNVRQFASLSLRGSLRSLCAPRRLVCSLRLRDPPSLVCALIASTLHSSHWVGRRPVFPAPPAGRFIVLVTHG